MEFQEVLRRRRMIRNLTADPIPRDSRDRILDALQRGPSAGFSQGFEFLICEDENAARFWQVAWPQEERTSPHAGVTNSPLVIVPCAHRDTYLDRYAEPDKGWTDRDPGRWPAPFWIIDAAFAAMLALLAVTDEQLGALYFGLQREDLVRSEFKIPDDYQPIGAIAIGHPAPDTPSPSLRRGRRPAAEVLHHGTW
jgi:nitroreductase